MRRLLAAGLLLAGCTAEPQAPAPTVTPGADAGITLPYREVYRSSETDRAIQDKLRHAAIRSDDELTAFLTSVYGSAGDRLRAPFALDFARETGLFMTAGVQPDSGTQLRLTRLTEAGGRLEVRFSAYGGLGAALVEQPYWYLAIPRTALPVDIQQDVPCRPPPGDAFSRCR